MGKSKIIISVLGVVLTVSILIIFNYQTRLSILNQRIEDLENNKNDWTQKEDKLNSEMAILEAQIKKNNELLKTFPTNNPEIINFLRRQGFNGGVQEIIEDLIKHKELIPYEGVLGGTMDFCAKESVFVISDKWVLAYFEDGHIGGNMLLRYSIKNGDIYWKVIDSYLLE